MPKKATHTEEVVIKDVGTFCIDPEGRLKTNGSTGTRIIETAFNQEQLLRIVDLCNMSLSIYDSMRQKGYTTFPDYLMLTPPFTVILGDELRTRNLLIGIVERISDFTNLMNEVKNKRKRQSILSSRVKVGEFQSSLNDRELVNMLKDYRNRVLSFLDES